MLNKNAKYFLSLIFMLALLLPNIYAQDLDFYKIHYDKGMEYYKDRQYTDAISEFILAKNYIAGNDTSRMQIIDREISKTNEAMNRLLNETKEAKEIAQAENQKTKLAKAELERTLSNKQKILSSFYFYNDQLALAYKNNRYGFINKDGNVLIEYIYEEARPFDYTGLSKASYNGTEYLLEENGERFKLAREISQLDSTYRALDLGNKGYHEFPEDILKYNKLEIIKLNNNQLRELPQSIAGLSMLRRFYIYNNRIINLPDETGLLHELELLDASNNRINEIPASIGKLTRLTQLIIYDNNLNSIPDSIGALRNLQFLDVSKNLLEDLPPGIGQLQELNILALGENQFKQFPPALESLSQLLMLDISRNYIQNIPSWIGELESLTNLHVSNNGLQAFPDQITELQHLRVLAAGNNMIRALPDNMDALYMLEELILSGNQLKTIPYEVGRMVNLRKLDLRNNSQLEPGIIAEVFANSNKRIYFTTAEFNTDILNDLGILLIRIDTLHTIPWNIKDFHSLQVLDINNCTGITAQDISQAFNDYPGKILYTNTIKPEYADTNELMIAIELDSVLINLSKIEYGHLRHYAIDLSGQDLTDVPDYIFDMENLVSLDLSDNQLSNIPDRLYQLTGLKTLFLHHNELPQEDMDRTKESMPFCEVHY